jgi:hypothetical protein
MKAHIEHQVIEKDGVPLFDLARNRDLSANYIPPDYIRDFNWSPDYR